MHVSCLVPEVLELLEELVKAYSCLELTHYLYLWGMYCVQSLCEVVSLSWALVVASPLLGFSWILFKMCNLWVNFEASMWSQGEVFENSPSLIISCHSWNHEAENNCRWKNACGDCIDAGTHSMIVCFKSWHLSHQYRSDTGSMLFSSSKSDLMLPVRLRSWHSLQELTTECTSSVLRCQKNLLQILAKWPWCISSTMCFLSSGLGTLLDSCWFLCWTFQRCLTFL